MKRSITTHPRLGLALALALVAVLLSAPVPVLDEESYLDIASQLHPGDPYGWTRPWQPWGAVPEADAFVYAHPPLFLLWAHLWGKAARFAPGATLAIKVAMAVPWAALLGWSVGRLAERCLRHPWLAAGAYLAAPIVLLGAQRGLMPDLMVTALSTFALVAWMEGLDATGGFATRWMLMGGAALAGALFTKYPAALLIPALLYHGHLRGRLRQTGLFWAVALGLFALGEGWLAATYGRVHLLYVLQRADEIGRGPLGGRALGVLARAALLTSPLPALLGLRRGGALLVLTLAGIGLWVGLPADSGPELVVAVAAFALAGALLLVALGRGLGGDARRADLRALSLWGLLVAGGVVLGHNFAAPRYLLPAAAPLVLVLVAQAELAPRRRALLHAGVAAHGLLGLWLTVAEHDFAAAADRLAAEVLAAYPGVEGAFVGEWSFRHRMRQGGWTFSTGTLPSGALLAAPTESAPPELPPGLRRERVWVAGEGLLRVVDGARGIGLYGETIGPLPFGFGAGPLEAVTLWRAP